MRDIRTLKLLDRTGNKSWQDAPRQYGDTAQLPQLRTVPRAVIEVEGMVAIALPTLHIAALEAATAAAAELPADDHDPAGQNQVLLFHIHILKSSHSHQSEKL